MPDYSKGKIYTIRTYQCDDIYIGSTTQRLCERIRDHRDNYKHWLNGAKKYMSSYEILKYDDYYIELLEDYPCENKQQLKRKEGEYQREMDCVNKRIECRTTKEWYIDNKDKIKQKVKQYYNDNKDKRLEQMKEYYIDNKDKKIEYIKQYRIDNKEKILEYNKQHYIDNKDRILEQKKQHYIDNKEKILEQQKQYRIDNKEKILKRMKQKITCDCGCIVNKGNIATHKRTNKHKKLMQSK